MTEVYSILVKCRDCNCPVATIQVPELKRALEKLLLMPAALITHRTTCLSCGKANFSVECRDQDNKLILLPVKQIIEKNILTIKT